MPNGLFYLFAAAALISGALVILKRDPLISAIFLIVTLANIAGIYLVFGAGFLASIQVIVYAGAVMVLFLFIIMLLPAGDADESGPPRFRPGLGLAAGLLGLELIAAAGLAAVPIPPRPLADQVTVGTIGEELFGRFLIPLELVSFLLLVAVVGVVMLTGRDRKHV